MDFSRSLVFWGAELNWLTMETLHRSLSLLAPRYGTPLSHLWTFQEASEAKIRALDVVVDSSV